MKEEMTTLLSQLAEKLGTTTEYLWEVLIKQAQVEIIINICFIIFSLVLIYGGYKYCRWVLNNWSKIYDNDTDIIHSVFTMIVGIVILIFFIASIATVGEIATQYYNPEYWALNEIINN